MPKNKKPTAKKTVVKSKPKKVVAKAAPKVKAVAKKSKTAKVEAKKAAVKSKKQTPVKASPLKSLKKMVSNLMPKKEEAKAGKAAKPGKSAQKAAEPSAKDKKLEKPAKLSAKELKELKEKELREAEALKPVAPKAPPQELILTDAEGRRLCKVKDCDQPAVVEGYCRYHYLFFWKKIQNRKKILSEGKLDQYIEELTARYPLKFLELIRKDLGSEADFLAAIQELDIDESSNLDEFEDENYMDEVRGMGSASSGADTDRGSVDDEF